MWNLPPLIFSTNLITIRQTDWIAVVFLILVIITALIVSFHKKKISLVIQSFFSQRHFSLLIREGKVFNERFYILSLSIILLSFSLFCYTLIDYFFSDFLLSFSSFSLFIFSLIFIVTSYLFHFFSFRLFCYFFDYKNDMYYFCLYRFFFFIINSLILFPILLCYYYIPLKITLPVYLFVFFLLYFLMYIRIFRLKTTKINLLYFFIYFCTLEFLPYVITLKWVKMLI